MDIYTPKQRSELMAKIGAKNTGPEMTVRSVAHRLGYRFRLHRRDLPGTPDLAMVARKVAVFVNGCFWHQHHGCSKARPPRTRQEFWRCKLAKNVERDQLVHERLAAMGWRVLIIWECETRDKAHLAHMLINFIEGRGNEAAHRQ